jgi:hypothetical protein
MDWSVAVLLEEGQIDVLLSEALGDKYDAFRGLGLPSWKMDELMIAWGRHVGIPLKKLRASPDSSASTGARSRRTSGGSTGSGSRASRRAALSWRELDVLLAELPSDSATARSLNGGERPWTPLEHLLAGIFDTLQVLAWQNANQGRKSPTKRPTPLPRPGIEPSGVHYGKAPAAV